MKGTTKKGFSFEIDEEVFDDYEFFETLCDIDNGVTTKLPSAMEKFLGAEQKERLIDSLRNEKGKVSTKEMTETFLEIINLSKAKN